MQLPNNQQAFLALMRAGLWEKEVQLVSFGQIDFNEVYRLAEEQSVVGLVAAGLEHVVDTRISQEEALCFAGSALQLEQRNTSINLFIGSLVENMRQAGIYALLIKGQGIAQCYERPLWRMSGDIDLFLSKDNYQKAKRFLAPFSSSVQDEDTYIRHIGYVIDSWPIEIHGTLRNGLWKKLDREVDEIQNSIFYGGCVRLWMNGYNQIFLPRANEDVMYIFTHILQHFFKGGIGLRQLCDWCRLLWTYRETIDKKQLEKSLKRAGVWTEWKTFAALGVKILGMPQEAMPFYSESKKWKRKAKRVLSFVLETGNFGHNRDISYKTESIKIKRKALTLWYITKDSIKQCMIFPNDSIKVWLSQMLGGLKTMTKRWR